MPIAALILAAATATSPISIEQPWFRYIVPQVPAGGYMTLHNASAASVMLTGASSPACGMLMLHKSETRGGTDRMEGVGAVAVPAHGSLSLRPGGYHLMCMEPHMAVGQKVPVTLTFQGGQAISAEVPVFGAAGKK